MLDKSGFHDYHLIVMKYFFIDLIEGQGVSDQRQGIAREAGIGNVIVTGTASVNAIILTTGTGSAIALAAGSAIGNVTGTGSIGNGNLKKREYLRFVYLTLTKHEKIYFFLILGFITAKAMGIECNMQSSWILQGTNKYREALWTLYAPDKSRRNSYRVCGKVLDKWKLFAIF